MIGNVDKKAITEFSVEELKEYCSQFSSFTCLQILDWVYVKKELNPQNFSNLSKKIRDQLIFDINWKIFDSEETLYSKDGTVKFLFKTQHNDFIETVFMPTEKRNTLCISSQVGCARGCTFCQTGKMGLMRNLSVGEIIGQIITVSNKLQKKITNIVFMGMGEPLDNFDAVTEALKIMTEQLQISSKRITLSTAGVVPPIYQMTHLPPVRLAISLHQADQEKRMKFMPISKEYPLSSLKKALLHYYHQTKREITFEYVLIEGKNDSLADAKKLVHFLHGLKVKVNLIPLNQHPGLAISCSSKDSSENFQSYLAKRSIPAPIRYSRGSDISAACGQLANKKEEELSLPPRIAIKNRRSELAVLN